METTVIQPSPLDETIDGLNAIRAFLADHDLPPVTGVGYGPTVTIWLHATQFETHEACKDEFARCARILMAGAPVGSIVKNQSEVASSVIRHFGVVKLEINASRAAVCERRVIGVEKVEVPDPAAPRVEVDREIVEWVCEPILSVTSEHFASLAAESAEVGK